MPEPVGGDILSFDPERSSSVLIRVEREGDADYAT